MQSHVMTFAGSHQVLLAHMSLLGTALIVEDAIGPGKVVLRWTDEVDPRPQLRVLEATPAIIGDLIREHASGHASGSDTWLEVVDPNVGSLFSTRTKAPNSDEAWIRVLNVRASSANDLRDLDSQMVVGLGERAWWYMEGKQQRPDRGASAWEMRTRNRGLEFVANTLLPLADAVSHRTSQRVEAGLTGFSVDDEVGKNKPDSRTATGFAAPGPTDSAVAWTALWGLAAMPVWHHPQARSTSSASLPPKHGARGQLLMPMATQWVTPARMQMALRSRALLDAVQPDVDSVEVGTTALAARRQLAEWGFTTLLRFPVQVSGSTSAPERRALAAVVVGATNDFRG